MIDDLSNFPLEETKNPDEIIVSDIDMVHFEMMDDGFLWCGIYHKNGQIDHFNITAKGKKLSTLWSPNTGNMNNESKWDDPIPDGVDPWNLMGRGQ